MMKSKLKRFFENCTMYNGKVFLKLSKETISTEQIEKDSF